jgi:hypothetical protein
MTKEEALEIYLKARSITEEQYTSAQLATDGIVKFDYQKNLKDNLRSAGYDHNTIFELIKPEPRKINYDLKLINGLINLNLNVDETLDEISYIYPRALMMLGMQKRNGNFVWVKFKLRGTDKVFEIGVKQ